ncbi:hypothetical protein Bbelb_155990 [Branchiostoma belcheri]|nr:hypothetical protein Bbelb_155990 [Branchiostoma belcheri]
MPYGLLENHSVRTPDFVSQQNNVPCALGSTVRVTVVIPWKPELVFRAARALRPLGTVVTVVDFSETTALRHDHRLRQDETCRPLVVLPPRGDYRNITAASVEYSLGTRLFPQAGSSYSPSRAASPRLVESSYVVGSDVEES